MHRNAYLLLLLTMLFWAGNAIAGKLAIGHVSPMILTATRWGLTLVVLAFIGRRQFAADWPTIRQRTWFFLVMGMLGFTIFSVAMYCAVLYTSATNVSIEQGGMPLFVFVMSFVTLSFLVTTPECWVPDLGDSEHGFPYLSGRGRLVLKDTIMMGAALVTMADSAKAYLRKTSGRTNDERSREAVTGR